MANRPAPALALREGDRARLERRTRASSVRAGLAQRARIVLPAADGVGNTEIAERAGVARGVTHWSTRLLETRPKVGNSTIAKAWRRSGSSRGARLDA